MCLMKEITANIVLEIAVFCMDNAKWKFKNIGFSFNELNKTGFRSDWL